MRYVTGLFILATVCLNAQEKVVSNNPCANPFVLNKKSKPQAYNREADIVWSKQIWRELDLRERLNLPLYFPLENEPCRISLFQLISKHILTGEITAFAYEEFYKPYSVSEVRNKLVKYEEAVMFSYDSLGNECETTVCSYDSVSIFSNVIKVRLKEDWYLNSSRSDLEVNISAMAFYEYVEDKEAYKELFWVFFPSVQPLLAKYRIFNPKNADDHSSFDDLFSRRQFSSIIIKESNVYDRYISDYCKGADILKESDRIKNELLRLEKGLWRY